MAQIMCVGTWQNVADVLEGVVLERAHALWVKFHGLLLHTRCDSTIPCGALRRVLYDLIIKLWHLASVGSPETRAYPKHCML